MHKRLIPVFIYIGSTTQLRQYRGVDDSNLRICPPQITQVSKASVTTITRLLVNLFLIATAMFMPLSGLGQDRLAVQNELV